MDWNAGFRAAPQNASEWSGYSVSGSTVYLFTKCLMSAPVSPLKACGRFAGILRRDGHVDQRDHDRYGDLHENLMAVGDESNTYHKLPISAVRGSGA
jgi:hypothetical protein